MEKKVLKEQSNPDIPKLQKAITLGCLPVKNAEVILSKQPSSKLWNTSEGRVGFKFINKNDRTDNPSGDRHPTSVIECKRDRVIHHSTQKPIELCEWLIKSYTNENDVVLDFTMGSGTTPIACINTNRIYIGIEKDEDIFNKAKQRIDEL